MIAKNEQLENLKAKRSELENKVRLIFEELKRGLNPDKSEQATELENYDVLIEILRVSESGIKELNKKIYQIENSNY